MLKKLINTVLNANNLKRRILSHASKYDFEDYDDMTLTTAFYAELFSTPQSSVTKALIELKYLGRADIHSKSEIQYIHVVTPDGFKYLECHTDFWKGAIVSLVISVSSGLLIYLSTR
ncbi:hypothetical protein [Halodesulfovibrio sp. MK-HDV]|jgi:hypothetical protein|uniref:hypothetical protein n=1 Tax=Halodesulfovibrio sp. MK-HDV TaxID=2599925 RepID=UPI00136A8EFB|nr:hypothetical protein [Halodesulfovibrio sp. MK-HDV]KAF1073223.1 hypothetical protein MKHDV_03752 [Halodesulfovibrio sp. MK-HDV]